jgi:hypothetical protein
LSLPRTGPAGIGDLPSGQRPQFSGQIRVDLRLSARGRALGTLIGTNAAPTKVLVSGEGVALASVVLDTAAEYARSVRHWTLPDVPIEIAPFTFTEWAKGAAVIALRNQLDSALRPDA